MLEEFIYSNLLIWLKNKQLWPALPFNLSITLSLSNLSTSYFHFPTVFHPLCIPPQNYSFIESDPNGNISS